MDDSEKKDGVGIASARTLVKECFGNTEDAFCHKKSGYSIPTYSLGLDPILTGLHKSDLVVVAARPGVGKSAFVHNIIGNTIMEEVHALLFSPEMCKQMVIMRILSIESRVPFHAIECGELLEGHWPKFTIAAGRLSEAVLNIDDALPLSISRIIKIASEKKSKNKLDLLVIDSLPFISADNNESKDVSGVITMALKCLARDLDIPVLLTVPLKTVSPEFINQRPCLSDIGNDSIVNYADMIILLHKTMSPNKKRNMIEALVVKNRNGEQGIAPFYFLDNILGFGDCAPQEPIPFDLE